MKKNSKNSYQKINDFFAASQTSNQKAWGLINDFYHLIISYMQENKISQAKLAMKLGRSRSSISQLFNQTPNISLKKMVEIADAIGITLNIDSPEITATQKGKGVVLELPSNPRSYNWIDFATVSTIGEKITSDITSTQKNKDSVIVNHDDNFIISYIN